MSLIRKDIIILVFVNLVLTFLLWFPFLLQLHSFYNLDFSAGFSTIYRNYDGLNYIVVAKSFYNPSLIAQIPQPLPANYFAAHFPGFPALIDLFGVIMGDLKAMLFVSVLFTVLSSIAFYFLIRNFKLSEHPLWMSLVFLVLPARWLIVHSVGSPEPIFIFLIILGIYNFLNFEGTNKKKYLLYTSIFGSLAILVRSPGILFFIALSLYIMYREYEKGNWKRAVFVPLNYPQLLLIPTTLVLIFFLFYLRMGDFFAYFHSGDNIHLGFPPFQVFDKHQYWVGDIWLEDIIYIFILGFLGGLRLLKTNLKSAGFFVLTYLAASIFVAHRDISRYVLPIFPFVLISFEKVIVSKEFKIVIAILILGIYLYAENFIIENAAPAAVLSFFN